MLEIDKMILSAMKDKNDVKLKVSRAIKAEILSFKTAKNAKKYDDLAEIDLLKKMCKQRKDSIQQYKEACREDLVQSESLELEELNKLLPKPVDASTIEFELTNYCILELKLLKNDEVKIPKSKMGICIKHLKEMFPYEDGGRLSKIVKQYVC